MIPGNTDEQVRIARENEIIASIRIIEAAKKKLGEKPNPTLRAYLKKTIKDHTSQINTLNFKLGKVPFPKPYEKASISLLLQKRRRIH